MQRLQSLRRLDKQTSDREPFRFSKLCLLSVRIRRFAGWYEPRLIGRQESRLDSRDLVKHAVLQGERNVLLYKGKNSKALQMESMQNEAPFLKERVE